MKRFGTLGTGVMWDYIGDSTTVRAREYCGLVEAILTVDGVFIVQWVAIINLEWTMKVMFWNQDRDGCSEVHWCGSSITSHPEKKWALPWAWGAPQNWGFPFNISVTTEDSDFKIGRLVEFAKGHHKIPPRRKKGRCLGLEDLPKIWCFPCSIYEHVYSP